MKKVFLAAKISPYFTQQLIQSGYTFSDTLDETITGIITSNKVILDKNVLSRLTNLKWIARLGSGMEIIDQEYCMQHNIYVCNSPSGIAHAVAEHALACIISLLKNIHSSSLEVKNGQWIREPNRGQELCSKTIGIIGYGHTGSAFVKLLLPIGMPILVYDPKEKEMPSGAVQTSLEEIYAHADIVSYHVPLTQETKNYYSSSNFHNPHYLINTSRGEIARTEEIISGFKTKKLLGACLDVLDFESEFPNLSEHHRSQLDELASENTIITPHIAGYSFEAIEKMSAELIDKLSSVGLL